MPSSEAWVGSRRPHRPHGSIAAMYGREKQHCLTKVKAPSYSFGTRHELPPSNQSPVPQYMVPPNVTRVGRVGTPAFSLYGRQKDPGVLQPPAPGQYSLENATKSIFRCAPIYSFGLRHSQVYSTAYSKHR
uniref:Outer dense fiber protein 3-like protein 2 n=1 Tax=Neogobius melanostomus TaxID=47308 RepID=A0A8C6WDX8_9GOBI